MDNRQIWAVHYKDGIPYVKYIKQNRFLCELCDKFLVNKACLVHETDESGEPISFYTDVCKCTAQKEHTRIEPVHMIECKLFNNKIPN